MPRLHNNRRQLTPIARASRAVTLEEQRLAQEYLVDLDSAAAGARAGLSPAQARGLLGTERVQLAIARERSRRSTTTQIYADEVLRRWDLLAYADPRELAEHWRVPCRYCWGHDHRFQFTSVELREAEQHHLAKQMQHAEKDRVPFDDLGGDGYTINRAPCRGLAWAHVTQREDLVNSDHDCPSCHGHGISHVKFHDTRHLSPAGRALYKGIKVGAHGAFEILTHDQIYAQQMLTRHLGLLNDRRPPPDDIDPEKFTDDQLDRAIASYEQRIEQDREADDVLLPAPAREGAAP